ncbi:protein MpPPR_35 [Marchantia polymorpha subsp. ruderalis]|uniref:PROP1-like PPR domain-containing protein n=2 Tax=Marchantia polymorpha TaxID=3197 RepID=A0A176WLQ6_MARPO|nr:hypothetical protein AXG93_2891s1210 [Marchantia polymorpha subsp. ruderalis]PTQ39130.1 hypothetical protein MARPO_0047s0104 [Marchantia polymorpha]PTQ39131.1 hypothetical protein MARPO_0047s0104 [Marchantia polymorpha]BBN14786.1 hypothetical protein Mp_6g14500 [Marchantia polymorpha subsp. ruderalis]BBN14787.1 hypothetical protein Mp_6g14500 [Marchantia polymorpha subsp. ruderalis]|eukprot:PTQ39130.1 hypothetical protein MARPO_0047s0104 [Marchantia polymorpha]
MATLNFQHLQLRSLNQLQWRCVHGELDVKDRRSSVALSSTGFNDTNIIKSQLSSVQKVTSALENVEITKTSPDFDQVTVSGVSKQKGSYFNDQQKQWYKMMNEIRMTGDAVPVLEKQRKSKQSLTREGIVGTLVRLKQLRVWRSIMEICEWLAEQDWWQFGFEDYSLLMMAYGKEGEPEKAEELMKRLVTANHTPNIAIYTGLMEAYARTKMYSEAEALMQRLIKEGPPPTNLTYHTLMKAYVEGNRLDDAERVFSSMNDEVKADGRSYNLMIHAYGKAGRVAKAHELYQEMKHLKLNISIVTYNTLIASQKNCRDAESIYRQMQAANVRPDVYTYTGLMNVYGKARRTEATQNLFDEMVACGIRPTRTTYNVLLDAYAKSKQVDQAEIVLKRMRKDKCTPTIHSFTTLVHAYALVGQMDKAEEIMRRMKSEGVAPNVFTFSTMMSGYAAAKDLVKMMKKFNDMKNVGLRPNQAVYTVLISAWGGQEDFEAVKFWFREMVNSGFEVDQRARSALIVAAKNPEHLKEALDLLEENGL